MFRVAWVLAGCLALMGATEAGAVTVTVDFSGSVTSGTDGAGLFGADGANLAGDTFSAEFLFDNEGDTTTLPGVIQSSTLTIGGVEVAVPVEPDPSVNPENYGLIAVGGTKIGSIAATTVNDGLTPTDQIPLFLQSVSLNHSYVDLTFTVIGGGYGFFNLGGGQTSGILEPTVATADTPPLVLPLSGAPEPATWAIMVIGFAAVGTVVRRRATAGKAVNR